MMGIGTENDRQHRIRFKVELFLYPGLSPKHFSIPNAVEVDERQDKNGSEGKLR